MGGYRRTFDADGLRWNEYGLPGDPLYDLTAPDGTVVADRITAHGMASMRQPIPSNWQTVSAYLCPQRPSWWRWRHRWQWSGVGPDTEAIWTCTRCKAVFRDPLPDHH